MFITGYDPSGQAVEWGKNDISRIYRLSHIYDKIQSKHDSIHGKVHKRKCYKLRRIMFRIHKKSVVLLMIVTINLPNGCVKVIVLFYCLSLRHRKWLNAENGRFVLRLHG